ncbi:MAG: Rmf/CrpP family protein [Pikeienuella sp.]
MTNPIVEFKKNIGDLIERKELALPSNVSPDAFKNAAIVAVQDNPKILGCEKGSVFKSIRTLAAAGLVPDGREAALVPFKAKQDGAWIEKCQAMPMVFGLVKMVRRSGQVRDIRAHIVYQGEVDQGLFEYVVGDEESLTHKPILFGERGAAVAAYAIAILTDGNIVREFMSADDIDTVRRSSSAQKIYAKGKKPEPSDEPIGIWKDWGPEMWKKSVIRRLCKRLDMSSEDMRRVMVEQDNDMRDVTPEKELTPLQQKIADAQAIKAAEEAAKTPDTDDIPDADVIPEGDDNEPPEHWTALTDTGDAFPGADEFTEGVKARQAGMHAHMCPHDEGSEAARDWLGGWDQAGKVDGEGSS